jgi:hypothetical protein
VSVYHPSDLVRLLRLNDDPTGQDSLCMPISMLATAIITSSPLINQNEVK